MVSDRLKKFIFDKLYKELSHLEIIPYDNSLFFIDRKEKYWYLEVENNGTLYWRFGFFSEFFQPFSMESPVYVKIISDWVEEVLNHKVSTTIVKNISFPFKVEEVLNHKVSTTKGGGSLTALPVEEVLNHKVSTTNRFYHSSFGLVEQLLNHKVKKIKLGRYSTLSKVDEIVNHKVSTTTNVDGTYFLKVEDVLNQN